MTGAVVFAISLRHRASRCVEQRVAAEGWKRIHALGQVTKAGGVSTSTAASTRISKPARSGPRAKSRRSGDGSGQTAGDSWRLTRRILARRSRSHHAISELNEFG